MTTQPELAHQWANSVERRHAPQTIESERNLPSEGLT
jgi:hypothetical protein